MVELSMGKRMMSPLRVNEMFALSLKKPRVLAIPSRILKKYFLLVCHNERIFFIFWGIASVLRVELRTSGTR